MKDASTLVAQAYAAFNARDIDSALATMTEGVSWPKASEGGRAVGKQEIRDYWVRQWSQFDPRVRPLEVTAEAGGRMRVRVHQLIRSLGGATLSDSEVVHVFTLHDGLISAMHLGEDAQAGAAPSAAFTRHP